MMSLPSRRVPALPHLRAVAAPRRVPGTMNQTELRYSLELDRQQLDWKFEKVRLVLADGVTYCPDFLVKAPDGVLEVHEVKGFMRDDARVKLRVAARTFPWFRFRLCRWDAKAKTWAIEEVQP